jgi:hypothetical protein
VFATIPPILVLKIIGAFVTKLVVLLRVTTLVVTVVDNTFLSFIVASYVSVQTYVYDTGLPYIELVGLALPARFTFAPPNDEETENVVLETTLRT